MRTALTGLFRFLPSLPLMQCAMACAVDGAAYRGATHNRVLVLFVLADAYAAQPGRVLRTIAAVVSPGWREINLWHDTS